MTLAITGASGQFGRRAAELVLAHVAPSELVLITRSPAKLADFAALGVQVRAADFDHPDALANALQGVERVLMISTDAVGAHRTRQHENALQAMRQAGVQQVIYTSFIGAGLENPAISAREHGVTEAMLQGSGMAWTFLRDSQYSEAMALFAAPGALASGVWLAASGEGRIGLVSREDCVAAAAVVLASPGALHAGKVYNLTGPEALSYRDCARLATELAGRPIAYTVCSDEEKLAFFDSLGVPRVLVEGEPFNSPIPWPSEEMVSFERGIREGWFDLVTDDFEHITGRKPRSLREVYEAHAAVIRGAGAPA
jgi:NAD(P)H dehydrogenase (quinone)